MRGDITNRLDRLIHAGPAPFLWLALVVGALYVRTLGFGFTALDDEHLLLVNRANLGSWSHLPQAFHTDVYWRSGGSYYRPVLNLSLMLDHALGKGSSWAYHLGNLLLHMLACWVAYLCLRAWGSNSEKALALATLFAVHPVLVQAVAWIPGRNDILLSLFVLSSFYFLIRYMSEARWAWLALHLFGLLLSLFTKETALLAPLVFLAYYWASSSRPFRVRLLYPVAGWAAAITLWLFMRAGALGAERFLDAPRFIGWSQLGVGLLSYLGKIALPLNLSVLPLAADVNLVYGAVGTGLLVALTLSGGLRHRKAFWFGLIWFLLFLLPTFIPSAKAMNFLEHRLHLPFFGILLLLGQSRVLEAIPYRVGMILVLSLSVIMGILSFHHSNIFANGESFWSNAALTSPHSSLAQQMLGRQYFRAGRISDSIERYRLSLQLEDAPSAHNDLGLALMKNGELDSAEISFRRVLKADSCFANVYNNLALIDFQRGNWELARQHLAKAERLSPRETGPLLNTGVLMLEIGRPDSAEQFLKRALAIDPRNPEALLNLGIAQSLQGRIKEALALLLEAHRLWPGHPLINLRLAQLYLLLGRPEEATKYYQAARRGGSPADVRFEK